MKNSRSSEARAGVGTSAVVVDLRPSMAFLGGHLPGAVHLPPGPPLAVLAPRIFPPAWALHLLADLPERARRAARALERVGYRPGELEILPPSALADWARSGGRMEIVPQLHPEEAADRAEAGEVSLVDVRTGVGRERLPVPGAVHLPLRRIAQVARRRLAEASSSGAPPAPAPLPVPNDRPLAILSERGLASAVAAGLLQLLGHKQVLDVVGGARRWRVEVFQGGGGGA